MLIMSRVPAVPNARLLIRLAEGGARIYHVASQYIVSHFIVESPPLTPRPARPPRAETEEPAGQPRVLLRSTLPA
jgi:hypothetical protein